MKKLQEVGPGEKRRKIQPRRTVQRLRMSSCEEGELKRRKEGLGHEGEGRKEFWLASKDKKDIS